MTCLTEQQLRALAQQAELPPDAETWREHLTGCPQCSATHLRLALTGHATTTGDVTSGPMASAELGPPVLLERGTSFGRYLVLEKLGEGGMGEVYAAYDPQLDRKVALKLLHSRTRAEQADAEAQARLLREAQAMAQLSHPNVLPVFDAGEHEGAVLIAMELVEGGSTLWHWLKEKPRQWREVAHIFVEAGKGLAAAHRAGLVHRDFKPENVMLRQDGRVYVMDFGLARSNTERLSSPSPAEALAPETPRQSGSNGGGMLLRESLTQAGVIMGTPGYMAPEQYARQSLDGRADQFSFCASLYFGLYGQRAFVGSSVAAVQEATLTGQVQPPPRDARVPGWLHKVVLQGLSPRPEERFASMEALLAALQEDPSLRRRRWAAAAAVLLAVGAGTAAYRHTSNRKVASCRAEGQALTEVWSAMRQDAVESAFHATGKLYAKDAWRGVKATLDGYVASLGAMSEAACLATRVRGEASDRVLALRTSCLRERHGAVNALVDVFAQADAEVMEKAVGAARGLKELTPCADVDWLVRQTPVPTTPGAAETLEVLRTSLAQAQALHASGKYEAAITQAASAVEGARNLPYLPLEAEALLQLGGSEVAFGKHAEAETHLVETVHKGIQSHHEELSARAAATLISLMGSAGRISEVRLWFGLGKTFTERAPAGRERTLFNLHSALGIVQTIEGNYVEAEQTQQQALRLAEQAYGPDSAEVAAAIMGLAGALLWQQKYAVAVPLFERAVVIMERALGADHPRMYPVLCNLGAAYSLTGRLEESLGPIQRAAGIAERTMSPLHRFRGVAYNNLGNSLLLLGRHEEAARALGVALEVFENATPLQVANLTLTLSNLADVHTELGQLAQARAFNARALQVGEAKLAPGHENLLRALFIQGALELAEGKPARAIPVLERVLRHESGSQGDPNNTFAAARFRLAQALWSTHGSRSEVLPLLTAARAALATAHETRYRRTLERFARAHGFVLPALEATAAAP